MNTHGADGVVHFEFFINEFYAEHHQHTGEQTDNGGTRNRHGCATCGNGHQTRERAVERHGHIGLFIFYPGDGHGGDRGRGGSDVGRHKDAAGIRFQSFQSQRGPGVKTEPSEPEDEHAQSAER
ncbi:hypothetical protein SDC9_140514 [bioreactor metagenome]|uniref:Uncharacterized protein n=1 Tax=bioreactor metagenome TaxID=1076179 RepID=A0A645DVH7_9ZZZZ